MKNRASWLGVILLPVIVLGGLLLMNRNNAQRNLEWPTQMQYSPAYLSQTPNPVLSNGITQQMPVAGTIPRGHQPFHYGPGPEEASRAGAELKNPFPPTEENLARGRQVFNNYCAVCHGTTGAGDGPLIPKYPNPPAYNTDKSKALEDGNMFHVITLGRKDMPSHAALVSFDDRWKAVLHIRKLQGK
jgi:mono/diheme cytochrome c family protein